MPTRTGTSIVLSRRHPRRASAAAWQLAPVCIDFRRTTLLGRPIAALPPNACATSPVTRRTFAPTLNPQRAEPAIVALDQLRSSRKIRANPAKQRSLA